MESVVRVEQAKVDNSAIEKALETKEEYKQKATPKTTKEKAGSIKTQKTES